MLVFGDYFVAYILQKGEIENVVNKTEDIELF